MGESRTPKVPASNDSPDPQHYRMGRSSVHGGARRGRALGCAAAVCTGRYVCLKPAARGARGCRQRAVHSSRGAQSCHGLHDARNTSVSGLLPCHSPLGSPPSRLQGAHLPLPECRRHRVCGRRGGQHADAGAGTRAIRVHCGCSPCSLRPCARVCLRGSASGAQARLTGDGCADFRPCRNTRTGKVCPSDHTAVCRETGRTHARPHARTAARTAAHRLKRRDVAGHNHAHIETKIGKI